MEPVKGVRWKEGTFIRPHHFQQMDRAVEVREAARLDTIEPLAWGLVSAEISEAGLAQHALSLTSLRAVFPSGTLVDVPGNARAATREFRSLLADAGKTLDVKIGLRHPEERVAQVGGVDDETTRFVAEEIAVSDLDAGGDPVPLEFVAHRVRLFFGDETTSGYETIPLMRLRATGNVTTPVERDASFVPPTLRLSASPALLDTCRATASGVGLALHKIGRQARGTTDFGALVLHQALSGVLPVLRDLLEEGACHPRTVYRELARLAGTLLFRDEKGRTEEAIPAYRHDDVGPVFRELDALIRELIEGEAEDVYLECPMSRDASSETFTTDTIPPEGLKPGCRYFLELRGEHSESKIPSLVSQARISAPSRIEHLNRFAILGVRTEPLGGPPGELPRGLTGRFFRLKTEDGNEWDSHVVPAGRVSAHLLGAPQDVEMTLWVVLPRR